MRDSEIKTLFAKADEQVHVDEIRKQKTYHAMIDEMEKQRTPMMSTKNILFHQFWYMDKLFFAVYGVLICLGIIFITALQYTGQLLLLSAVRHDRAAAQTIVGSEDIAGGSALLGQLFDSDSGGKIVSEMMPKQATA